MAILPGNTGRADDFINESERNATPANDAGRVVKLEADGRIAHEFLSVTPLNIQEFSTPGSFTWTKPIDGTLAIVELWGAGASGCAASRHNSTNWWAVPGGGGGGYKKFIVPLSSLSATEDGVVGAGGAARVATENTGVNGANGGNTTFKGIVGEGGKGGSINFLSSSSVEGVGGLGGAVIYIESGGNGGDIGTGGTPFAAQSRDLAGAGGASAKNRGTAPPGTSTGAPGASVFGGNGGEASVVSGSATATAGASPGGGGGAALTVVTTGTATSGAGGNGYVRITVF